MQTQNGDLARLQKFKAALLAERSSRAETAKAVDSLADFVRQSWHVVEPAKGYMPNWHIDAISEHLQAVADGQIQYLLINIPPGHAKSLLVSVQFPAWLWLRDPRYRLICGTYASDLSIRDAVRARDLINSNWYQQSFRPDWQLKADSNAKDQYYNTETGFRISVSVTGKGTGLRGNGVILDDVLSVEQSYSDAERMRACRWVSQTMSSRRNDLAKDWQVAIGQRLHESDPYGEMIASGDYVHLCLPSEYEPERRCVTSIGWSDPRSTPGELLFPDLFPRTVIEKAKKDLGSYAYAGQHQQTPSPAEGGIFKRHWWRYWCYGSRPLPPVPVKLPNGELQMVTPVTLPDTFDEVIQSWDMAFKDLQTSDFVVGQVWGKKGADRFMMDLSRDRRDFPNTVAAVRSLTAKWPEAHAKLVEDKANGSAVIATLKGEIPGLIAVNPEGGKESRASAASPIIESGNVYLPHPQLYPWVQSFIDEHAVFPNGTHDDQVDAHTQAQARWSTKRQVNIRVL